jgi:PAS domain S-box-containing protein
MPFTLFFPAVWFAAWFGGLGPGALAILLSGLLGSYFFAEPTGSLWIRYHDDQVALLMLVIVGFGMAFLSRAQELAVQRAMQAENAERQERQRFETTLESIGDAVITTDADGNITFLNSVAQSVMGWTPPEAVGKPLPQIFAIRNEETGQEVENPAIKALREGRIVGLANHTVLLRKDGTAVPIDDSAAPIRQPSGRLQGTVLVFRDITARKKVEEALRQSERRERDRAAELSTLLEAAPIPLFIVHDPESRHISGNRAADELLRNKPTAELSLSAPSETRPQHFRTTRNGQEIPVDELPAQRAARGEHVRDFEFSIVFQDGESRDVIGYGTPLFDSDGKPRGAVHILVDITERKRAQELQARYLRMMDSGFDAIIVRDGEGRITYWNRGAMDLYGWTREEALGQMASSLLQTAFSKPVEEILAEVRRNNRWEGELSHTRKDGSHIVVFSRWTLEPNVKGEPAILEVNRDITLRKRTEESLRQAHLELRDYAAKLETLVQQRTSRLNEIISDLEAFSYSIVHDMRAPLRAMQGFAQLLAEECGDISPAAGTYVQRIKTAAARMDQLIQDGFSYSRLMQGQLPLTPMDFGALLRGIIETYPAFQPPQVEIQVEGPFPLILGNEAALTQCISNLLGNAIKFVSKDAKPHVRIWAEEANGRARFYFRDNGIGIDREYHDKIFQIFQRLDPKYEGTGVGLAIVKKAVERMGGRVGLESAAGQGSTFWLELEVAKETQLSSGVADPGV